MSIKEPAQDGGGLRRSAPRISEFLCCLAARIRALCASKTNLAAFSAGVLGFLCFSGGAFCQVTTGTILGTSTM